MPTVRGVIAASMLAGSISASAVTSANVGVAPARMIASAVAMKVFAGTITSSPGRTSRARSGTSRASVPLATPMTWSTPT